MQALSRSWCTWLLLALSVVQIGCEYVRPTLNAPLEKWEPNGGYRFSNIKLPETDNTDSLLFVAAFSDGGTRASTLAFATLLELAHQEIIWDSKKKRLLDELDRIHALSGGTFAVGYYALYRDLPRFMTSNPASFERIGRRNSNIGYSGHPAIGSDYGRRILAAPISWRRS